MSSAFLTAITLTTALVGVSQAPHGEPEQNAYEAADAQNEAPPQMDSAFAPAAVCEWDYLPGNFWQSWTYAAERGEIFAVEMDGSGRTDLDLFVYDAFGNLIASDLRLDDYGRVVIESYINQEFTIVVENLGNRGNSYDICVD